MCAIFYSRLSVWISNVLLLLLVQTTASIRDEAYRPQFSASRYEASVVEHGPVGKIVVKPPLVAVDPKSERNLSVDYAIVSGNEGKFFRLQKNSGLLSLLKPVDREREKSDFFTLHIQASFADFPQNFSRVEIHIEIVDVNDHAPRFAHYYHNISIIENLPVGFSVLKLTASDPDKGDNGLFTYSLQDSSQSFSIDEHSGWIVVANQTQLDREKKASIRLFAEAVEKMPSSANSSRVLIDVYLIDSNDNNPSFVPTNVNSFRVDQTAPNGTIIGKVVAIDPDLGENGRVLYSIQNIQLKGRNDSEDSLIPFGIHPDSGEVFTTDSPLNLSSYTLLIEAADQPQNPSETRYALALIQISVISEEEKLPKFMNTPYEFWVGATAPIGTSIGQVTAVVSERDVDYSFKDSQGQQSPVDIDQRTGVVRTALDLQSISVDEYLVEVVASSGVLNSSTNVVIHIVDFPNAKRSLRDLPPSRFSVPENAENFFVGNILDTSDRRNAGEDIEFALLESESLAHKFVLHSNGSLYTKGPLDRETISNASLQVILQEKETQKPIDVVHIIVNIQDVNDNPPRFGHDLYVGHVVENSPAGTPVQLMTPVSATDPDISQDNLVRFSLRGPGSEMFSINVSTGALFTAALLDRELSSNYNFSLIAADSDNLTSTSVIIIFVDDINDNVPELVGFFPDNGKSGQGTPFRNTNEGLLVNSSEKNASFATSLDSGFRKLLSGILSHTKSTINDAKNHEMLHRILSSALQNSSLVVQVPENETQQKTLGHFVANDKDEMDRSGIRFILQDNDEFLLDAEKGTLVTKTILQPESLHLITVKLVDSGGLETSNNVVIQVIDINNHAPAFEQSLYELTLPEGLYDNFLLKELKTFDEDVGDNAKVSYRIINESTLFYIHDTGAIYVNGKVDRESSESFHFRVEASDHGDPVLSSIVDVIVRVQDVNDNPPRFLLQNKTFTNSNVSDTKSSGNFPLFTATVDEHSPPRTHVLSLQAIDADIDFTNKNVSYQLESHQDLFSIDSWNGSIFTKVSLESEKSSEYNVIAVAFDHGVPSLSSTAVVQVKIHKSPCNPNPSASHQRVFNISIEEGVQIPYVVKNFTSQEDETRLIMDQTEPFRVDNAEPVLWLTSPLDRESASSYTLHLLVQPRGKHHSCNTGTIEVIVNVEVLDLNDNAPSFEHEPLIRIAVSSEASVGKQVFTFKATDPDAGLNSSIKFAMESFGRPKFAIDSLSGIMKVAEPLVFDGGKSLNYIVKATDRNGASDGKTSSLRLTMDVVDRIHQVTLVFEDSHRNINEVRHNITRVITEESGLEVFILGIDQHSNGNTFGPERSYVIIYALHQSDSGMMSAEELSRVLHSKRQRLHAKLDRYKFREIRGTVIKTASALTMESSELMLIAFGGLILLATAIVVACVVLARRKRAKRRSASAEPPLFSSSHQLEQLPRINECCDSETPLAMCDCHSVAPYSAKPNSQLQVYDRLSPCYSRNTKFTRSCVVSHGRQLQSRCCEQESRENNNPLQSPFAAEDLRRTRLNCLQRSLTFKEPQRVLQEQPRLCPKHAVFGYLRSNCIDTHKSLDRNSVCSSEETYEDSLYSPEPGLLLGDR